MDDRVHTEGGAWTGYRRNAEDTTNYLPERARGVKGGRWKPAYDPYFRFWLLGSALQECVKAMSDAAKIMAARSPLNRRPTVEAIQVATSIEYRIPVDELRGPSLLRAYARPRQVAMYLCRRLTKKSTPEIGRRFGGRDHSTIIHGCDNVHRLLRNDGDLREIVTRLETLFA